MTTTRPRDLLRADLRRGAVLLGLLLVVPLGLLLLLLGALTSWPRRRLAAGGAQAAADRLFPGEIRVLRARGRGEAGGYTVDAELVADPSRDLGWVSERRSPPGSLGERRMRAAVATVRDRDTERAVLIDVLRAAGLTASRGPGVQHEPSFVEHDTSAVRGDATLAVAAQDLAGVRCRRFAERLDAAALSWPGRRIGLVAEPRHVLAVHLVDGPGPPHSRAEVAVEDGRLHTSAVDTLGPVMDPGRRERLSAALLSPVRAFLEEQGLAGADAGDLRASYLPDPSGRLALRLTVTRDTPVPGTRDSVTRDVLGWLRLTAGPDGAAPSGMRWRPREPQPSPVPSTPRRQ